MLNISIFFITTFYTLISYSFSSYCGSYIPYSGDSCFQYTNSSSICCFLRGNFEGNYHTMCYPISRSIYYKMARSVKINGYTFKINCGESRGTLCGDIVDPKSYKDCSIFSKKGNSCCYYEYKYKNPGDDEYLTETNCVWLGTGDIGEMSYNKLTLICKGEFYKCKFLFMLMILFVLF